MRQEFIDGGKEGQFRHQRRARPEEEEGGSPVDLKKTCLSFPPADRRNLGVTQVPDSAGEGELRREMPAASGGKVSIFIASPTAAQRPRKRAQRPIPEAMLAIITPLPSAAEAARTAGGPPLEPHFELPPRG